jgi:hypothetical protein
MAGGDRVVRKDRIRDALRVSLAFHILIFLPCSMILDGGGLAKIAAYALIPFWPMVGLIVWRRRQWATRVDYALIAYLYPLLFGGYFLWNTVVQY